MPDGVARLRVHGVELDQRACHEIRGIRYLDGETVAEARFPSRCLRLGVRRTELHAAMVERAADEWRRACLGREGPGDLRSGSDDRARADLGPVDCGADGLSSRVRRWAGLEGSSRGPQRFGVRRHFRSEPWTDLVEVYWGTDCEAYVTPVGSSEVGVALLWSGAEGQLRAAARNDTRAGAAAAGRRALESGPRYGSLASPSLPGSEERVALVGDAAGYRDAITGEGLSMAFHQAAAWRQPSRDDDLRRVRAASSAARALAQRTYRWSALRRAAPRPAPPPDRDAG